MADAAVASSEVGETAAVQPRPWLAVATLAQREWVRFVRQRNRVFSALGTPLLFWILFGAGLGPTFQLAGGVAGQMSYREYFFPGTVVLIVLFTAIFTTISVIEDRREGFLQSVLVAPLPRWSMVLGKLLGGSAIAFAQGGLFLALSPTLGLWFSVGTIVQLVAFVFLVSFALTAMGFMLAWRMDSTQGFHAVMNLLLMPMWLLSGAFFPAASGLMGWIVRLNPLTYGVAGLRRMMYADLPAVAVPAGLPGLPLCWGVMLAFAAVCFVGCWLVSASRTTGDLQ
ncbi:MAG: ABC transporter permease [Pirellulales bacterium]